MGNDLGLPNGSNHGRMVNSGGRPQNDGSVYASTGQMNMGMPGNLQQDPSSVFHSQQQMSQVHPQQTASMSMNNSMMGRGSQHNGLSHSQHGAMNNNGLSHSQHNPHSNNMHNMDMQQQHYMQGQQVMQQGLGSLADLRARMQQQQQRQFSVFNTGNNNFQSMPNPDLGMQNKLQNLTQMQQSMFAQTPSQPSMASGTFEFEPRPIAPGNESSIMHPQSTPSMGQTNEPVPSMGGPHKATMKNSFERQGSDKSLEMGSVFEKAIHGGPSTQGTKEKMGNSAGSGMSISLGDIDLDDDDDDDPAKNGNNPANMAPPAPRSSQAQVKSTSSTDDPDELTSMFNSSMNFKQQQQQKQPAQTTSTDKSFEMSVNTLGDSGNLFNSNASMNFSEASFGDVFDDGEKDMLAAS